MLKDRHLIGLENEFSPANEAYRKLRTNLQFINACTNVKSLLFSSSVAGEGKSTTVANVAVTLAQAGKKVVIADCDLRNPVQHLLFGRGTIGITNVLCAARTIDEVLQNTIVPNLRIVTSGAIPPNPSELLASEKMAQLLQDLKNRADYVIIDSPPILPVTDACILASRVDGVVVVLGAGIVRVEAAKLALESMEAVQANVVGVMINREKISNAQSYYYSYYASKSGSAGC
jgi:capsular exopolysaccharide synthesis family protein